MCKIWSNLLSFKLPQLLLKIASDLKLSGKNPYALESTLKIALEDKHIECAWILLKNMPYLRQHFFWPLLLHAGHEKGELGKDFKTFKVHSFNLCVFSQESLKHCKECMK